MTNQIINHINWENIDKNIESFSLQGRMEYGKCVDVYDGDTIKMVFPLHNKLYKWSVRLSGIDTPELRTRNKLEKLYGYKVRKYLRKKILNKILYIECDDFDKYGRLLGYIYLNEDQQKGGSLEDNINYDRKESINQWLIDNDYAFSYDGGTKKDWSEYLLQKMEK